jgi:hypothetical protein
MIKVFSVIAQKKGIQRDFNGFLDSAKKLQFVPGSPLRCARKEGFMKSFGSKKPEHRVIDQGLFQ